MPSPHKGAEGADTKRATCRGTALPCPRKGAEGADAQRATCPGTAMPFTHAGREGHGNAVHPRRA
jgi:hypothetical protein